MELTPKQQVLDVLRNKQKILLLTHKNPDGDAIGSILALYLSLKKMGKEVIAVCNDPAATIYDFLPELDKITTKFSGTRDFIISVDISKTKPDKIMYKIKDNTLDIVITPKNGKYEQNQVKFSDGGFNSEAIVVLDSPDFERLGSIYEKNSELFYELPVINIDHHAGNDYFGKINLVDITATSTCEILVSIIEALTGDPKFIVDDIATALLTGIITDTNSFQNLNTTPKSLTVAAQLVASGARQQDIIKKIYKTRALSTLRLWGRALANLRDEKNYNFVWTELRSTDFLEVGAAETESSGVIDELLKTASGVDFALLLTEKGSDVHGSLRSTDKHKDVRAIATLFGGGGHELAAAFQLKNKTLAEASDSIIQKIKSSQDSNKKRG
ncbi:MAG: DHH family phosphoesterase [bacterium]